MYKENTEAGENRACTLVVAVTREAIRQSEEAKRYNGADICRGNAPRYFLNSPG